MFFYSVSGNHSCFNLQTSIKANLATLAYHIKSQIDKDSYTGRMQRNPHLALAKVMEEFWEVVAGHQDNQVSECSDLFVHLVMYLNGIGVTMEDIFNELNNGYQNQQDGVNRWLSTLWIGFLKVFRIEYCTKLISKSNVEIWLFLI